MDISKLHLTIAEHLEELSKLFLPGVKLTFFARSPDIPDAQLFVSEDDIDSVVAALDGIRGEPERVLTHSDLLRAISGGAHGNGDVGDGE